jgi:hypothetical protein
VQWLSFCIVLAAVIKLAAIVVGDGPTEPKRQKLRDLAAAQPTSGNRVDDSAVAAV